MRGGLSRGAGGVREFEGCCFKARGRKFLARGGTEGGMCVGFADSQLWRWDGRCTFTKRHSAQ